jgi:hypothetical protein
MTAVFRTRAVCVLLVTLFMFQLAASEKRLKRTRPRVGKNLYSQTRKKRNLQVLGKMSNTFASVDGAAYAVEGVGSVGGKEQGAYFLAEDVHAMDGDGSTNYESEDQYPAQAFSKGSSYGYGVVEAVSGKGSNNLLAVGKGGKGSSRSSCYGKGKGSGSQDDCDTPIVGGKKTMERNC